MKLAWARKVSPEFARKVIKIAAKCPTHPNNLMSCMAFESGETFSPHIKNKHSSATGLIQFMHDTAVSLGTTTAELAKMTAERQLDYVEKYFKPYFGRLKTIDDLYMAILWPKGVGKPSTYVLFDENSPATRKAYFVNKGIDADHNGQVTKAEAAAKVREKLSKGLGASYVGEVHDVEPLEDHEPAAPEIRLPPPEADDETDVHDTPEVAPHAEPEVQPEPVDGPPEALPPGVTISGDPATWWIQYRLKSMNYDPGRLDGKPGGKTFAAVTGFVTDWPEKYGDITPPKSTADFLKIRQQLRREIDAAEAQRFVRPVTKERADADPKVVKEVAPESVNQKRGVIATAWTAIVTFFAGLFNTFSGYVATAWNWITGAKDQLPDAVTEPGWLSWAFGKLGSIPPAVWFFLVAAVLAFVCFGLIKALSKTVDDVRTGKR